MTEEFLNSDYYELFVTIDTDKELKQIKCLACDVWFECSEWKIDIISLDEKRFGKKATHVRLLCPNCLELYDHRDKKDFEFEIIQEIKRIVLSDVIG